MTEPSIQRRRLSLEAFTECWYVPGETHIVDLIHPDDGLMLHNHEDGDGVRQRYAGAERMTCNDAWTAIDAAALARYRKDVEEVSEERFMEALNVLPPVGWTTRCGVESFRISERLWGNLTDIYARLGDRYFKLVDDIRLPAATIAERLAAYAAAHPAGEQSADSSIEPQRPNETAPRLHDGSALHPVPKPGGGL